MKCMNCGHDVANTASYCPRCGKNLTGSVNPPKSTTTPWRIALGILAALALHVALSVVLLFIFGLMFPNKGLDTGTDNYLFYLICQTLFSLGMAIPSYFLCARITKSAKATLGYGIFLILRTVISGGVLAGVAMTIIALWRYRSEAQARKADTDYQLWMRRPDALARLLEYKDFAALLENDPHLKGKYLGLHSLENQMSEVAHAYGWITFDELEAVVRKIASETGLRGAELRTAIENKPKTSEEQAGPAASI